MQSRCHQMRPFSAARLFSFAMIIPASACQIPLRRLAILSELWFSALVAGLHIACGGPSLSCSGSSMGCSPESGTYTGGNVQRSTRPYFRYPGSHAARSSCLDRVVVGMVRHYHRYGRCLPQSFLQVALSLCSRNDSLLPSSRLLLLLIAVLSSAVSLPFVVRILHGPVWIRLSGRLHRRLLAHNLAKCVKRNQQGAATVPSHCVASSPSHGASQIR